jgi:hypothetical protein
MTEIIAMSISLIAVCVSAFTLRALRTVSNALAAAQNAKAELQATLVDILDDDGSVRGRLALPGHDVAGDDLRKAQESLRVVMTEVSQARTELEAERARARSLESTLANVVDADGSVLAQIRIPGKVRRPPNRTPCGSLCAHAHWHNKSYHCAANEGRETVSSTREMFLDDQGQCVMFQMSNR